MKINVKTEIKDYEGNPIRVTENETLLLGSMIVQALNHMREEDANLEAEKKVHRAVISQDVFRAMRSEDGTVDMLPEDIDLAKELMGILFNPLPLMRAYEALEVKLEEVKETA